MFLIRKRKETLFIEASPRQATGNLHRKEIFHFQIRSPTPPQAAGNALAFAVHLNRPTQESIICRFFMTLFGNTGGA